LFVVKFCLIFLQKMHAKQAFLPVTRHRDTYPLTAGFYPEKENVVGKYLPALCASEQMAAVQRLNDLVQGRAKRGWKGPGNLSAGKYKALKGKLRGQRRRVGQFIGPGVIKSGLFRRHAPCCPANPEDFTGLCALICYATRLNAGGHCRLFIRLRHTATCPYIAVEQ